MAAQYFSQIGIDIFSIDELQSEDSLLILLRNLRNLGNIRFALLRFHFIGEGRLGLTEPLQTLILCLIVFIFAVEQFGGDVGVLVSPGLDGTVHFILRL